MTVTTLWQEAGAASPAAGHGGEVATVILVIAVMLATAKIGGDIAARLGQPEVLGELVGGVVIGNLHLAGLPWFHDYAQNIHIDILAQIGVLILLFEVGLESTIRDMLKVGVSSLLVATLGVVTPFALGWGVGMLLLPDHSPYVHAFLGATLTATSVGITARVLSDLGRSRSAEARIILGAAVIDDVMGLVILAIVTGAIAAANQGQSLDYGAVALIIGKAVVFLGGALTIGTAVSPRLFRYAARLRSKDVLLVTALVFMFLLSWLAATIGLAPIVGAYAAGLILEHAHWRGFSDRGEQQLEQLVRPVATLLVPLFFVLMGLRVDLSTFARLDVIGLAAALTIAAIIGKQACSFGVVGRGLDRLSVGLGMIPRGEVGLIFASIGATLMVGSERVIDEATFSAVVIMVIITTMVTPPALKWSLTRGGRQS